MNATSRDPATVRDPSPREVAVGLGRHAVLPGIVAALVLWAVGWVILNPLGDMPGEVLQCRNRHEGREGCGSSRYCGQCGVLQSLTQALRSGQASLECVVVTEREPIPIECQATASRVNLDGALYLLLTLVDQRDENRRRTLERLFFHDVLNTAGNVTALSQLLPGSEGTEAVELQSLLHDQARRLADEIRAQRDLSAAPRTGFFSTSSPCRP